MRMDGKRRSERTPEDYEELRGSMADAERLLRAGEVRGADAALKRAGVKAAAMWGGVGVPVLPGPVRELISFPARAQILVAHEDGSADPGLLLERLTSLRSVFEREAARETGAPPAKSPG